ncbi:hypothetical protein IQ07DRAFT_656951 [Pyrenochaeta sp. DS3sAY3a]|nr:hypothetical protein IQ07DRAFT_656951 [Pyrenochaeta sp. DS3sAY3a]
MSNTHLTPNRPQSSQGAKSFPKQPAILPPPILASQTSSTWHLATHSKFAQSRYDNRHTIRFDIGDYVHVASQPRGSTYIPCLHPLPALPSLPPTRNTPRRSRRGHASAEVPDVWPFTPSATKTETEPAKRDNALRSSWPTASFVALALLQNVHAHIRIR